MTFQILDHILAGELKFLILLSSITSQYTEGFFLQVILSFLNINYLENFT